MNWYPKQQPIDGWDSIIGLGLSQINYPTLDTLSSRPLDLQAMLLRDWTGTRLEIYSQLSKDRGGANRPGGDKDGRRWGFNLIQSLDQVYDERFFAKFGWEDQSWRSVRAYSPGFKIGRAHV